MPPGSRSQPAAHDARERILVAAQRCIDRHGIHKTTMDDIAREVRLSRPSVYRYFADRDALLIELIARRAGALVNRAQRVMSRQSCFTDQIIEGLLNIADYGRRDPLTRYVIDPDGTILGQEMIASGISETIRAQLFDPYLDAAVANNELPQGLPRGEVYLWLGTLVKTLMRGLEDGEADLKRYRSMLRRFVAPAFAYSSAHLST
jgi:AcrR family transcriptional regulator